MNPQFCHVFAGQTADLEQREAAAVEAEDFETAALLSAELDGLKAAAATLQASIVEADLACSHAVRPALLPVSI